jgi:hypothetical protein
VEDVELPDECFGLRIPPTTPCRTFVTPETVLFSPFNPGLPEPRLVSGSTSRIASDATSALAPLTK